MVEKDRGSKMRTPYTPEFLSLRKGIWAQEGGDRNAGDEVVIGYVDSGINALHPSFVTVTQESDGMQRHPTV